jgi:hypothetical protein
VSVKNIVLSVLFAGACVQGVKAMQPDAMSLKDYSLQVLDENDWVEIYLKVLARCTKKVTSGCKDCNECYEFYEKAVQMAKLAYDSDVVELRMFALNLYSALVAQNQALDASCKIIKRWLFASKILNNEISHYRTLYLALAANPLTRNRLMSLANKASEKGGPKFRQEEAVKIYLAINAQEKISGSSSEAFSGSDETVESTELPSTDVPENSCYF